MNRRSFFKRAGAVAAALPLFKLVQLSAEEEKKFEAVKQNVKNPDEGLFTADELRNAGFTPLDKPVFKHEEQAYSVKTYKLKADWSAELEQDINLFHGVKAETEIKTAILSELKKFADDSGCKHKYILNAYSYNYIVPSDFAPRRSVYARMCLI